MFYEIRKYQIAFGRIDEIVARFTDSLPSVFLRHGIDVIGHWISISGPRFSAFFYMMQYSDLTERMRQWDAFYADPEWIEIRRKTNGSGEIVERFDIDLLRSIETFPFDNVEGRNCVDELRFVQVPLGSKNAVDAYVRTEYIPLVHASGGRITLAADLISGPALPMIALMSRWSDVEAWRAFSSSLLAKHKRGSAGLLATGGEDVFLLAPA